MMSHSFIFQVLMIVVAVAIGLLYIRPTLAEIKTLQDTTMMYQAEIDKVAQVNALLAAQRQKKDSVSTTDSDALRRYMPNEVDEVQVMKDISVILGSVNLSPDTLSYAGASGDASNDGSGAVLYTEHTFSVGVTVTYVQLKALLKAIEVNDYLLQVNDLSITPGEDEVLTVTFTLSAFALPDRADMSVMVPST